MDDNNDRKRNFISEYSHDDSNSSGVSEIICDDDDDDDYEDEIIHRHHNSEKFHIVNYKQNKKQFETCVIEDNSHSDQNRLMNSESDKTIRNKKFTIDNILGIKSNNDGDDDDKSRENNLSDRNRENYQESRYIYRPLALSPASICGTGKF